jgi:hypothetical protein
MLFLGAGSVIHAMHHEQDMRNYGGLRKKIPYTFWAMMIGTLAITGVGIPLTYIGFAGFFSKDAVVESAFAFGGDLGSFAFWALIIAAVFTSFYSWRLMFLTFFGEARGNKHTHDHAHESPMTMLVPLGVLALGAVFSGVVWYNSFFGKTDQVATFFGVEYVDTMAEGGHGDDAAHGEEAATDTHGEDPPPADAHGAEDAGGHGSDHHYVFTSPPGEGAIYTRPRQRRPERGALRAALGEVQPLRRDDPGLRDRLLVLHPQPVHPRPPRGEPAAALQLPAEQVVFRRGLRFPLRAARAVARPVPVEGRRRVGHRSAGSTGSPWGSSPSSPARSAGRSRATSSTTPSRWCSGSWS